MNNVVEYVSNTLSEFFIVTDEPYEDATDFNRKHPLLEEFARKDRKDGIKLTFEIHKIISNEVMNRFGFGSKVIGDSKLEIDLWDENQKIAYETILGDGEEIWKDILKAILVGAKKLVVFCRNYPDLYIKGYKEIVNTVSHLKPFLEEKLLLEIILIKP